MAPRLQHDMYSDSAVLNATGTGKQEFASTKPPLTNILYPPVLLPVSGQSCHDESEKPTISENTMDVTGGMNRKVEEASKIARMGISVFFVNGNKPERIVKAVKNRKFEGTLFRGKRNA